MKPTPPIPPPSRRRFLDWLLGTTTGSLLASVFYPVTRYLIPPPNREAVTNAVSLAFDPRDVPPNSGQIFKFGREPGILIKTPAGELRAFTGICTHLACTVQYREDLSHIWCACHNGHYDLNGVNIAGPPPRPLEEYAVRVAGSQISISKGV
jgi:Rieske Fe-S protein